MSLFYLIILLLKIGFTTTNWSSCK